jgi:hypothetical protein
MPDRIWRFQTFSISSKKHKIKCMNKSFILEDVTNILNFDNFCAFSFDTSTITAYIFFNQLLGNMFNIGFDQPLFILNEFKMINKTFC